MDVDFHVRKPVAPRFFSAPKTGTPGDPIFLTRLGPRKVPEVLLLISLFYFYIFSVWRFFENEEAIAALVWLLVVGVGACARMDSTVILCW